MPNKPCRFFVCEELKILTNERRNFIIVSPIFSVTVCFLYTSQVVQKRIFRIEGRRPALCVCVYVFYVTWSIYIGMGSFGLSYG